ncbi:MAG: FHIPEP family type III secretion protein [Planctomycetaceae bacterium]|nr:FHIPEP family type III secretion protein [Planctomycetaceae bacterium]
MAAAPTTTMPSPGTESWMQQSETLLSFGMLVGLVVMLVPLPPALLDVLLAGNLAVTTLLLLITLSAKRAMDLSVFPSLLLLLTLYRLSLNVATTRLILLDGDAGLIVTAFGNYVVGGQLVVGLVIFLILITIQFMVITKGATRVSEVSARFTLDALPGRQMAIDAELNSGQITVDQARKRRSELRNETEFYSAMDGASKFVRGDAVAGLIITAVNLIGGVIIGMTDGMTFAESIRSYSILTVGDGLVSQIPALIIATTSGMLVTKSSSEENLADEIRDQMLQSHRPILIGAGILGVVALMPGLPKLPFFSVSAALLIFGNRKRREREKQSESGDAAADGTSVPDDIQSLDEFLLADRAVVEVGSALVPFITSNRIRGISERITAMRREFARSNGNWIPPIQVQSNMGLGPDEYRFMVAGRRVAGGEVRPDQLLAIFPDGRSVTVPGDPAMEPAFQLPGVWIYPSARRSAELQGCEVVDPFSILITHLGEVLKRHAHELLTRETLKQMLDRVREFAPTIVEEIAPETVRMGTLHQVLVALAEDRIPLADLAMILESIVNHAPECDSADLLTDKVRTDLGRLVCEPHRSAEGRLRIIAIEPMLDGHLRQSLHEGTLALGPGPLSRLIDRVKQAVQESNRIHQPLALLVDQKLRRPMKKLLTRPTPDLAIIAYQELPIDMHVETVTVLLHRDIVGDTTVATDRTSAAGEHAEAA